MVIGVWRDFSHFSFYTPLSGSRLGSERCAVWGLRRATGMLHARMLLAVHVAQHVHLLEQLELEALDGGGGAQHDLTEVGLGAASAAARGVSSGSCV